MIDTPTIIKVKPTISCFSIFQSGFIATSLDLIENHDIVNGHVRKGVRDFQNGVSIILSTGHFDTIKRTAHRERDNECAG